MGSDQGLMMGLAQQQAEGQPALGHALVLGAHLIMGEPLVPGGPLILGVFLVLGGPLKLGEPLVLCWPLTKGEPLELGDLLILPVCASGV